jgi:hypothetical protein
MMFGVFKSDSQVRDNMRIDVPDSFMSAYNIKPEEIKHLSDAECFTCNCPVTTYSIPGDMIIVHSGGMCIGFRTRFTPSEDRPLVTRAMDGIGEIIKPYVIKKRSHKAKVVKEEGEDE